MRHAALFSALSIIVALASVSPSRAAADNDGPAYGPELQGFDYPSPVLHFRFTSQGESLDMAYMDVKPEKPNGHTAVLLHGKNFCAATWQGTIEVLSHAGYRVIAPDQIGFCKSTKPAHYQYSFQQLAANTHALLASIGIDRATVVGHSTGGMLAARYGLMYPGDVDQLVLVDPIGLEDWKAKGVPWQSVDAWYQQELKTTGRQHSQLRAHDLLRGDLGAALRNVGADAGRHVSRSGARHRRLEFSTALRHDLHPAGVLRTQRSRDAGAVDDRRQGHDSDRQEPRAARHSRNLGQLSGPR
jgi:pimeloyl-ACP methyl ester carboxylesterase